MLHASSQTLLHMTCYIQVIGVLHDKYLFKTRPRPLISKPDSMKRR